MMDPSDLQPKMLNLKDEALVWPTQLQIALAQRARDVMIEKRDVPNLLKVMRRWFGSEAFDTLYPCLVDVAAPIKIRLQTFKKPLHVEVLCESIYKDESTSSTVVALAQEMIDVYGSDDILNMDHYSVVFMQDITACARYILCVANFELNAALVEELHAVCEFEGKKMDRLQTRLLSAIMDAPWWAGRRLDYTRAAPVILERGQVVHEHIEGPGRCRYQVGPRGLSDP